ncbi:MAG: hypothetical protein E7537_04765 [Ruminococcaceae bacterium]|nr:hypothetical protein [Oscillospiraceae bacterium]
MKKIDPVVKKETLYIATVSAILSLLLQSVFLIIGKWDYTVLLGNIYGLAVTVGNFFIMGLNVQTSLEKEPDDAKKLIKASQSLRLLMLFVCAIIGYIIPVFNILSVIIPYLFPRFAISLRPLFKKD